MKIGTLSGPYSLKYYKGEQTAKEILDWDLQLTKWADEYGLTEAYFTEHYTIGSEPSPAPDLMIAAASQVTSQITLGALGHLVPYHNPVSLAFRIMWLDHMTGGRYIAGVAPGAFPTDAQIFNTGGKNVDMLYDALDLMEAIWTQEPPFKFEGQFYSVDMPEYTEMWHGPHAKPLQSPRPRVATTGNSPQSRGHIEAGKRGYIPVSQQAGRDHLLSHWTTYSEAADSVGRTPNRSDWRIIRDIIVADTDEEARELALNGPHGTFWREHLLPLFINLKLAPLLAEGDATADDVSLEYLVDKYWMVGSPETVAEKIEKLYDDVGGFGVLLTSLHDYTADPESMRRQFELLGREVLPRLDRLEATV